VKYRLLKSSELEPRAVAAYDRYVVPAARRLEARLRPPLGKNVLLIAEKP
jgi:proline dehydrogenase